MMPKELGRMVRQTWIAEYMLIYRRLVCTASRRRLTYVYAMKQYFIADIENRMLVLFS